MLLWNRKRSVIILTREQYLKNLIKSNGLTVKEFAQNINMPYSTLLTMLNEEKIGNAAVDSVIRICKGLNITIQELQSIQDSESTLTEHLVLTEHEKNLIRNYRQRTTLQQAVDILLLTPSIIPSALDFLFSMSYHIYRNTY